MIYILYNEYIVYSLTIKQYTDRMSPIHKLHQFLFCFGRTVEKSFQEELEMTLPQFMILLAIQHNPDCTQVRVAEWRKLTPAAISQHIDSLLKKKLIVRKKSSQDRREYVIVMTKKGEILFKKAQVIFEKYQKNIFKKVPKSAITQMNTTLDRLLAGMDASAVPTFIKNI